MTKRPVTDAEWDLLRQPTLSIPEAGQFFGLNRSQSYWAASKGYIPTIPLGTRAKRVPTGQVAMMLGLRVTRLWHDNDFRSYESHD